MNSLNRKSLREHAKQAALEDLYDRLPDICNQIGEHMVVAMLAVFEGRGNQPKYIKKFYEDLMLVLETPEIMGMKIVSNEVKKRYEKEYGIDFDRIQINIVSKEEFVKDNM